MGYRWYDAMSQSPAFAFGHGLSYSTFEFSDLRVIWDSRHANYLVDFTVANTGTVGGRETPQLYLGFPSHTGEPPWQLKGFTKVRLAAGTKTSVSFHISTRDRSTWDVGSTAWVEAKGLFKVIVGSSSRDPKALHGQFSI